MKRLIILVFSVWLVACATEDKVSQVEKEIVALEEIGGNPQVTDAQLLELLAKYEEYATLEGADTQLVANQWLRSGEVSARLQQFDRSLGYYDALLAKFPHNPKASRALFMKAYTLDNHLKNLAAARETYELFLEKYPMDDFADDAQFSLKNLGKSPEEIVKEFEARQKLQQTQ